MSDGAYGIDDPRIANAQNHRGPAPTDGDRLYVYLLEGLKWSYSNTVCFVSIKEGAVDRVFNGRLMYCDP